MAHSSPHNRTCMAHSSRHGRTSGPVVFGGKGGLDGVNVSHHPGHYTRCWAWNV